MADYVLFDYWRSSASYRVRIALNLKGVGYDRVQVDLAAGSQAAADYRAQNPQGFVPMLQVGDLRITQSLAIIDYLDATHPEPPLLPSMAVGRAHVLAMALAIACDVHPLNNLRVRQYLTGPLGLGDEARDEWQRHWIEEGFAALEAMAAPRAGRFLFGDAPTLADVCLIPQMHNARRLGMALAEFPLLVRAESAANALDAFAAAAPEKVAPPRNPSPRA